MKHYTVQITSKAKMIVLIFFCLSLICCKNVKDANENAVIPPEEDENISETDENILKINSVDFYKTKGYLFPGFGPEGYRDSSITFFGRVYGDFTVDNDDIQDKLSQMHAVVSLTDEDDKTYEVTGYMWLVSGDKRNYRNFRLTTNVKPGILKNKTNVEKVTLTGEKGYIHNSVGRYTIDPIQYSKSKNAFCFESPIDLLEHEDDMDLTYYIAVPAMHDEGKLDFNITISDNPSIVNASIKSWNYDSEITEYLKEQYSSMKTKQELKYLKVYRIIVDISSAEKNTVVQPYISVINDGQVYKCITTPLLIPFSTDED